jgi:hypothetical protein
MQLFRLSLLLIMALSAFSLQAQPDRWQQHVSYQMNIDFNATQHQFKGTQKLVYTNNSPDTLTKVFYHLYFNAFQPGSEMDVRSRNIADPDSRVRDRIFYLKPNEIGYLKVNSLTQNGKVATYETNGTILEVTLASPLLPSSKTTFDMVFDGQVPVQVRRSGRDNAEGVAYSMAQWYPKMSEYDYQGWHANPYVAREFYGVWGDYDVKITIDKTYTIGGSGYLQNPEEIGKGYLPQGVQPKTMTGKKLTWHFLAPNVHDFMWAADPEYEHLSLPRKDGLVLNFYYQPGDKTTDSWEKLPQIMDKAFDYINQRFGQYQYKQYSFVQGGDGGMEYPMATLITGERSLYSLVGVATHELMHSWYQMMLGTNESLYPWMDEGFTSYASSEVMNYLVEQKVLTGRKKLDNPQIANYGGYFNLASSGDEEPMTTHSDHYHNNTAYGLAAYSKGAVFLAQLAYVIGKKDFDRGLLRYFYTWKGKHPNANDCVRIFEKTSGLELDWYREYWVNTTNTIDYGIQNFKDTSDIGSVVTLSRVGNMPMPVDLEVTYTDGTKEIVNIPLELMRGSKAQENTTAKYRVAPDWNWTNPTYNLILPVRTNQIKTLKIDPTLRMADINRDNNELQVN